MGADLLDMDMLGRRYYVSCTANSITAKDLGSVGFSPACRIIPTQLSFCSCPPFDFSGHSCQYLDSEALLCGLGAALLQDLMDTLTADAEALGYSLKSPTFLSQPADGCVLPVIDLRVRMAMFEEELTPIVSALGLPNRTLAGIPLFGHRA